jgi:aspartyl-tRNA(Asn)/glutamyl-tRNA(Gln) amidotransferase subunit A
MTDDKALAQAREIDEKMGSGEKLSKIAGVPLALKDNFNWLDTITTASSKILEKYVSPYNATVTERLLNNGAVIWEKHNGCFRTWLIYRDIRLWSD